MLSENSTRKSAMISVLLISVLLGTVSNSKKYAVKRKRIGTKLPIGCLRKMIAVRFVTVSCKLLVNR